MFSTFIDKSADPVKFKEWEPKIQKYKNKLKENTKKEWEVSSSLLPSDPDKTIFNVVEALPKVVDKSVFDIISQPAHILAEKLCTGKLTAVDTFVAFAKAATIANQYINYAMEFFVDEGLKRAEELDVYFKEHGKPVGPLHGLPISLKEHYNMKNKVTHASYVSLIENVTETDAVTIQNLYEAGAVFYVRTSGPQTLMHLDSWNNITGRARNPHNLMLSPGGSSSGEGAVVAMMGSSMGVGSDIGGSIRAPAGFCGVWGLRPTQKRISMKNTIGAFKGFEAVVCVIGPLARYAEDIDLWMKSVIGQKPWLLDCNVVPVPWRTVEKPTPSSLKIGIIDDDGVVKPHPPIERGLKYMKKVLLEAGIEVVTVKPPRVAEAVETINKLYSSDSGKCQLKLLEKSGEPLLPLTKWALAFGKGTALMTAGEYRDLTDTRESIKEEYFNLMNDQNISFFLSPVYNGVAPIPSTIRYWGYTALWNLIDMPNLVFPTGLFQDPDIDVVDSSYTPRNDIEKYEYGLYDDPSKFVGAPISLQLTGRRYNDEELVKCGELISDLLSK